jgi:hypothetical protein
MNKTLKFLLFKRLSFTLLAGLTLAYATAQTVTNEQRVKSQNKKPVFASNSVLASGIWYKIATTQNGIYRIDQALLKSMGFNVEQLDPRNLKLYGRGAGMLPAKNSIPRIDDLEEIAIQVQGEADGKLNAGDFILFYGESQINQWNYDYNTKEFSFNSNLYSDTTYYFLTLGNSPGKRIQKNKYA